MRHCRIELDLAGQVVRPRPVLVIGKTGIRFHKEARCRSGTRPEQAGIRNLRGRRRRAHDLRATRRVRQRHLANDRHASGGRAAGAGHLRCAAGGARHRGAMRCGHAGLCGLARPRSACRKFLLDARQAERLASIAGTLAPLQAVAAAH